MCLPTTRDSRVIVTTLRLGHSGIRFPAKARDFSHLQFVQTDSRSMRQ